MTEIRAILNGVKRVKEKNVSMQQASRDSWIPSHLHADSPVLHCCDDGVQLDRGKAKRSTKTGKCVLCGLSLIHTQKIFRETH